MTTPLQRPADRTTVGFAWAKWSIFAVLILTYILVYFHRMAPGVVAEYLMGSFQITGIQLGTLSAIYFFVYAFMQLPSGVIADTLGTRTSVVAGNLVAGMGSILFGMSSSFEMACVGRFFVGLGVSVVFISIMKNNAVWFHERVFGLMSGLTLLIGNLGSVLAAGPLAALLTHYEWRFVFITIGGLSLTLSLVGFFIVRNRPEDLGFPSPNNFGGHPASKSKKGWAQSLVSVITSLKVWPGFWVQFGMIGGLYSFMGLWGVPYLRDVHGLSRVYAAKPHDNYAPQLRLWRSLFWLVFRQNRQKKTNFAALCSGVHPPSRGSDLAPSSARYRDAPALWSNGGNRFGVCPHFCRSQRDYGSESFRDVRQCC